LRAPIAVVPRLGPGNEARCVCAPALTAAIIIAAAAIAARKPFRILAFMTPRPPVDGIEHHCCAFQRAETDARNLIDPKLPAGLKNFKPNHRFRKSVQLRACA
jgi:hypothetical protein